MASKRKQAPFDYRSYRIGVVRTLKNFGFFFLGVATGITAIVAPVMLGLVGN